MKTVLILDDDVDLGPVLHELMLDLGAERCSLTHSLRELQTLPRDEMLDAKLALLDVNLGTGEPSGIDAYHWLKAQGFHGRLAFLTGHAHSHPLIKQALELPNVTLLSKPAPLPALENLLQG